jgi:hypothetical protein
VSISIFRGHVTKQADPQQRFSRASRRLVGPFAIQRNGDSPIGKEEGQATYNR